MHKLILTLALALLVISLGCSGSSAPIVPPNQDVQVTILSPLTGLDTTYNLTDILPSHASAAVVPGTTMTAAELRVYYSVNFAKSNFPEWARCQAYQRFMAYFSAKADPYMYWMVDVQEAHNIDVPNTGDGVPPAPLC